MFGISAVSDQQPFPWSLQFSRKNLRIAVLSFLIQGQFMEKVQCATFLCYVLVAILWKKADGIAVTLGQNPTFYPKIPMILILQKCEFCKK